MSEPAPLTVAQATGLWEAYRVTTRRGWHKRELAWALRDVNLTVHPGDTVGIIGPNGAGKSTLLQCLGGVIEPTRGQVVTSGRVATMVDLTAGFNRELSGRENAVVAGVLAGMSRAEARSAVPAIADFSELDASVLNSTLRTYSSGMILRLGFAVNVMLHPSLLLVDEVLAVGDESFQAKCLAKVRELKAQGSGVVFVSHNLDLIREQCETVILLARGSVAFAGSPDEGIDAYLQLSGGRPDEQDMSARALYGRRRGPKQELLSRAPRE
jgi:lipopolysaccharide transport system ATP-binding protein